MAFDFTLNSFQRDAIESLHTAGFNVRRCGNWVMAWKGGLDASGATEIFTYNGVATFIATGGERTS